MSSASSKGDSVSCSSTSSSFTIPYTIFMYQMELRRSNSEFMSLSKVKLRLTDTLITNTIRNLSEYDASEIMNISQQMIFKKRLFRKMYKIRKLNKLGIKDVDPNQISDDL